MTITTITTITITITITGAGCAARSARSSPRTATITPTASTTPWRPARRESAPVKTSLLALGVTAIFQLVIVVLSNSVALAADTVHNFSDAMTAMLWIAFVLGRRAATKRYTYGLGRVEDLAGLFCAADDFAVGGRGRLSGDPASHPSRRHRQPRLGGGRRRHRLHRQRTRRPLPHPGGKADRLGRAGGRRTTPAPTDSPRWRWCSARSGCGWASRWPIRSSACSSRWPS